MLPIMNNATIVILNLKRLKYLFLYFFIFILFFAGMTNHSEPGLVYLIVHTQSDCWLVGQLGRSWPISVIRSS